MSAETEQSEGAVVLQLGLNSAPGLADLFLNESKAGFGLWAKTAPVWSCRTPSVCLGDALGLGEVRWEQRSSPSCCSGDSHM